MPKTVSLQSNNFPIEYVVVANRSSKPETSYIAFNFMVCCLLVIHFQLVLIIEHSEYIEWKSNSLGGIEFLLFNLKALH